MDSPRLLYMAYLHSVLVETFHFVLVSTFNQSISLRQGLGSDVKSRSHVSAFLVQDIWYDCYGPRAKDPLYTSTGRQEATMSDIHYDWSGNGSVIQYVRYI